MSPSDDLLDDWKTLGLRPRRKAPKALPALDLRSALTWLGSLGQMGKVLLPVPGPGLQARASFYDQLDVGQWVIDRAESRTWLYASPVKDWVRRVSRLRPHTPDEYVTPSPWAWLWELIRIENLIVDEPLLTLADRPYSLIHEAMRLLFVARFAVIEDAPALTQVKMLDLLARWATMQEMLPLDRVVLADHGIRREVTEPADQIEVLLFLLTLAEQNGVVGKTTFVYDDLDSACHPEGRDRLREVYSLHRTFDRWVRDTEAPFGLILGFDPQRLGLLRRHHPRLANEINEAFRAMNLSKDNP